jgi:hypothetical protein
MNRYWELRGPALAVALCVALLMGCGGGDAAGPSDVGGDVAACPDGFVQEGGLCLQEPAECESACDGRVCGDDGCGGSCGTCDEGGICTMQGECVCIPECADKQCGDDGCGGLCGACPGGFECQVDTCIQLPCDADCEGEDCPQCPAGTECLDGACAVPECVPDCNGIECGSDGCGGECGGCELQGYCSAGHCYDCSEEGFCRAESCPDDGNLCTEEKLDSDGTCQVVPNYVCKEILEDLQRIYRGAQAYYSAGWRKDEETGLWQPLTAPNQYVPLAEDSTPVEGTCCWAHGGVDENQDNLCDNVNSGLHTGYFETSTWRFIDFRKEGPHRFVYRFMETPVDNGLQGYETLFEATVVTDLDCDGLTAEFKLTGRFAPDPAVGYEPLPKDAAVFSVLPLPTRVTYVSEEGADGELGLASTWPLEEPTVEQLASAYAIGLEDTYFWRFKEATVNLLRINRGASVYYRSPQVKSGLPEVLVAEGDEELLGEWGEYLPGYYPLAQGLTPVSGSCCAGKGADTNYDNRCDSNPPVWREDTWAALEFFIDGSHEWLYGYEESDLSESASTFTAEARRDPRCTGKWESLTFKGKLVFEDLLGIFENLPLRFEYRAVHPGSPLQVRLPLGSPLYNALLDSGAMPAESLDGPAPLEHTLEHAEAFVRLDELQSSITLYWADHCSLPEPPALSTPTGWACCNDDENGDGLCDGDVGSWSHAFWVAIGFAIAAPHEFRFRVETSDVLPGVKLVEVQGLGNGSECQGDNIAFHEYGILVDNEGNCTATWFNGYNVTATGP